jgi:signal transduction histidine kinase/CheY-like chemotaxis protein
LGTKADESMRLAIQATRMVTWEWLPLEDLITTSDNFPDVYGLPALAGVAEGFALVLPEDKPAHLAKVQTIAAEGGSYNSEFRIKRPIDGRTVWLEERAEARLDANGKVVRVIGVTLDITERKSAEQQQSFLLALSDAIRPLADPAQVEQVAMRLLGERLNVSGANYFSAEREDDGWYHRVESDYYLAPGVPSAMGRYAQKAFGSRLYAELERGHDVLVEDVHRDERLSPAERANYLPLGVVAFLTVPILKAGELIGGIGVWERKPRVWSAEEVALVHEVAERSWAAVTRARVECALRASEERLRIANRAKDEFLAILGHELRTPLAAIMLWSGALRSGKLSAQELSRAVEAIIESASAQSRLIDDLLDLTRLMNGKLLLAPGPVVVADITRGLADDLRPLAAAKKLALVVDVPATLGCAILDAVRLRQVMANLLSNAIKSTPAGGSVTLKAWKHDGFLEVEVTDTGEGIAPEFFPHLFERFRQADMGETRQHGGLGIGLALSRQLVELQGGTISAHSAGVGAGATFRVRLPWLDAEPRSGEAATPRSDPGVSRLSLAGVTVVLVEDDANTLAAMDATLSRAGATVLAVSSGPAALAAIDAADDPLVAVVLVSDLGLPEMSGYELVARVGAMRAARGRQPMPACAVTAHARDADKHRAIEAGFDMYVTKPLTPKQLIETVADLAKLVELTPKIPET